MNKVMKLEPCKIIKCPKCGRIRIHGEWTEMYTLGTETILIYMRMLNEGTIVKEFVKCTRCRELKQ